MNKILKIHVERGFVDYPDKSRLTYRSDGFTLSPIDSTLQFESCVEKELQALCGEYGIIKIELLRPFLFVHLDPLDPDEDYDAAVELVVVSSNDYLEQREIAEFCESTDR